MLARTPEDIGQLIRDRRVALGWDQRGLAARVGVSRQWVVEIEGGKPRAELRLVLRTLYVLGLYVDIAPEPEDAGPRHVAGVSVNLDDIVARARRKQR